MKKIISLFLAALMLLTCFTGCEGDEEGPVTLRVAAVGNMEHNEEWYNKLMNLLYPEDDIELVFEYLPVGYRDDMGEYEAQITRLRAEIMAGEGPDVFILPTWTTGVTWDDAGKEVPVREPLFVDVDEAMRNRIFYRLDDLMADSEMFNLEDHEAVIMEAGRLEDGQYVLPLLYNITFSLADRAQMLDPNVSFNTFEEYANCEDHNYINSTSKANFYWLHRCFPNYVDYDSGKLLISPEDIAEVFKIAGQIPDGKALWYESEIANGGYEAQTLYAWNSSNGAAYPLCVPNTSGGLTADITAYTAINANTSYPEEAFKFIQILYSDEFQTDRGFDVEGYEYRLCSGWCPDGYFYGSEWDGLATGRKAYTDDVLYDRAALDEIISRITNVRFVSEMDAMIDDKWYELSYEHYVTDEDYLIAAQELYRKMEMILAE